jgi:hypothetical protein
MASRAHVVYDYPLQRDSHWPRRGAWSRNEEPVVIPRNSVFMASGGLIMAALTAGALLAGSAYAMLNMPAPPLAETPTTPLQRGYTPDAQLAQANITNELSGPAHAVPQVANAAFVEDNAPMFGSEPSFAPTKPRLDDGSSLGSGRDREVIIDDSAPGAQRGFPQPQTTTPREQPRPPYPNPTTTPPEGIAPESLPPEAPAPALPAPVPTTPAEPENPYF